MQFPPCILVNMYKNKLFSLLNRLNRQELAAFQKHLAAYFSPEEVPGLVFAYVCVFYPHFTDIDALDPVAVHRNLFAGEPYNRDKILNAYSDIYQRLIDYLLMQKIKTGIHSRYFRMSILKERGLEDACRNEARQLRKEVNELPKKEVSDYLKSIEAHYYFAYLEKQGRSSADKDALQQYADDLDTYYAICRLKVACEMANLNTQYPQQYSFSPPPDMVLRVEDKPYPDHPLLLCYRETYLLLQTREEIHFENTEDLISKYAHRIGALDLHTIISYLHNYASPRIRDGAIEFKQRVHRLNKIALRYDLFSRKGAMSPLQFNNIIFAACSLKDFDWAERFILKQGQFLDDKVREVTIELAKATYFLELKYPDQALICLRNTTLKEPLDKMRAYALTLMCYYEKEIGHDDVDKLYTNFERYLKRKKEKYPQVTAFQNFTRIFRMLWDKENSRKVILKEIEQSRPLISQTWLLEKAETYKSIIYAAR